MFFENNVIYHKLIIELPNNQEKISQYQSNKTVEPKFNNIFGMARYLDSIFQTKLSWERCRNSFYGILHLLKKHYFKYFTFRCPPFLQKVVQNNSKSFLKVFVCKIFCCNFGIIVKLRFESDWKFLNWLNHFKVVSNI